VLVEAGENAVQVVTVERGEVALDQLALVHTIPAFRGAAHGPPNRKAATVR
jgi:hypothetical protein